MSFVAEIENKSIAMPKLGGWVSDKSGCGCFHKLAKGGGEWRHIDNVTPLGNLRALVSDDGVLPGMGNGAKYSGSVVSSGVPKSSISQSSEWLRGGDVQRESSLRHAAPLPSEVGEKVQIRTMDVKTIV